jgi:limonene-1,2-epoxide hydrolase
MPRDPESTVRTLFQAMENPSEESLTEILACFTDDAVWHNIPVDPAVGKPAIEAVFKHLAPVSEGVTINVKNIVTSGTTVIVERVDTHLGGGKTIVIPACGVFETRDGLISAWRDYFDMRTWRKQGGV